MFAFKVIVGFFSCKPAFTKSPAIGMLIDCVTFTKNNNKNIQDESSAVQFSSPGNHANESRPIWDFLKLI